MKAPITLFESLAGTSLMVSTGIFAAPSLGFAGVLVAWVMAVLIVVFMIPRLFV